MSNLAQNTETNKPLSPYEVQANEFLAKTGATIEIVFLKEGKHFEDDKENRDIYNVTIKRGNRSFSFNFGNSINNSGFYVQIGRTKYPIDRKYLSAKDKSKLTFHIKMSINNSYMPNRDILHYPVAPTNYSILSCLQKYDVGTFENFCSEFGYDTDSRKAEKTYKAVCEEYKNLCTLFTDAEIEEMQEIQ